MKESFGKNRLFWLIVLIPSITVLILSFLMLIPTEDAENLTFIEIILVDWIFISSWFTLLAIIYSIIKVIKNKLIKKEHKKNEDIKAKNNIKLIKNSNILNKVMLILFILSLFSLDIGVFGFGLLSNFNHASGFDMFKYLWGMLLALPIPLASFILGIKYRKRILGTNKNIIIGAIMTIILCSISLISLFLPTYNIEYNNIYKYQDIINIKLPTSGEYTRIEWDSSYLLNHVSNKVKFKNNDETNKFYNDLKDNDNWITKDQMSTNLGVFIPEGLICYSQNEKCYYSIYNVELNEYNSIPKNTQNYNIKAMMYDPEINTFKIEEYTYKYVYIE